MNGTIGRRTDVRLYVLRCLFLHVSEKNKYSLSVPQHVESNGQGPVVMTVVEDTNERTKKKTDTVSSRPGKCGDRSNHESFILHSGMWVYSG